VKNSEIAIGVALDFYRTFRLEKLVSVSNLRQVHFSGITRILIFANAPCPFLTSNFSFIFCEIVFSITNFFDAVSDQKIGCWILGESQNIRKLMVVGFGFATLHFALKYQCIAKSKFGIGKGLKSSTSLNPPLT